MITIKVLVWMSSSVRCFFKSATWSKGDKVLILLWGGSFPGALTRGTYVKDLLVKRNSHPMFGHLTWSWHQPWRTGTFIKKKRWREKTTGPEIQRLARTQTLVTAIHLGSKPGLLPPGRALLPFCFWTVSVPGEKVATASGRKECPSREEKGQQG